MSPPIRGLRVGSSEHQAWLERFAREAPFLDWLLFMHPEQERVALDRTVPAFLVMIGAWYRVAIVAFTASIPTT